jgi:hypothetical protein
MMVRRFIVILVLTVSIYGYEYKPAPLKIAALHPKDTRIFSLASGNVVQGIASYGSYWLTTQTDHDRALIFNVLNRYGYSVYAQRIPYASHGQDLSVLPIDAHKILLLTRGEKSGSVGTFIAHFGHSIAEITSLRPAGTYVLGIGGRTTPTLSTDGKTLAVYADNRIHLFRVKLQDKERARLSFEPAGSFELFGRQRTSEQWFQGIAMHNNRIYCLSGDNRFEHDKLLYIYDTSGKILRRLKLHIGYDYAKRHGAKWEMEGLTVQNGWLYTVVISGYNGMNIKHLYRILRIQ